MRKTSWSMCPGWEELEFLAFLTVLLGLLLGLWCAFLLAVYD
jgi:hypothetical protein